MKCVPLRALSCTPAASPRASGRTGVITLAAYTEPVPQTYFYSGDLGSFLLKSGEIRTFPDLTPGIYHIYEHQSSLSRVAGCNSVLSENQNVSINLSPLQSITCTLYHETHTSLTLIKQTTGCDGTFHYTLTDATGKTVGRYSITTRNGAGQITINHLHAQVYNLHEEKNESWFNLSHASESIDLTSNTKCTFKSTSVKGSKILIEVTGLPSVSIDSSWQGEFDLDEGSVAASPWLKPDKYSFREILPSGYTLRRVTDNDKELPAHDNIHVTLKPNSLHRYRLVNVGQGQLTLSLNLVTCQTGNLPDMTLTGLGSPITLNNGKTVTISLNAGSYDLHAVMPDNWVSTGKPGQCVITPGATTKLDWTYSEMATVEFIPPADNTEELSLTLDRQQYHMIGTAPLVVHKVLPGRHTLKVDDYVQNFDLSPGQRLNLPYPTLQGQLTLRHEVLGGSVEGQYRIGDQTVTIAANSTATVMLEPGQYEIVRPALPCCTALSDTKTINISSRQQIEETYTYRVYSSLQIECVSEGVDGDFPFTVADRTPFVLTTKNGHAYMLIDDITTDTIDVSEQIPDNWTMIAPTVRTIATPPGAVTRVKFINKPLRKLTLKLKGGLNSVTFDSDKMKEITVQDKHLTVDNLTVAQVKLTEQTPAGWLLDHVKLSDGQQFEGTTITVPLQASGETVATFYHRQGAIFSGQAENGILSVDGSSNKVVTLAPGTHEIIPRWKNSADILDKVQCNAYYEFTEHGINLEAKVGMHIICYFTPRTRSIITIDRGDLSCDSPSVTSVQHYRITQDGLLMVTSDNPYHFSIERSVSEGKIAGFFFRIPGQPDIELIQSLQQPYEQVSEHALPDRIITTSEQGQWRVTGAYSISSTAIHYSEIKIVPC